MPMVEMIDLSSVGTLTCIKSLAAMFESVMPPYPNDSQLWTVSFLLVRTIRTSCIIKSLNQ
jgi:hypothetical protein